MGGTKSSGACNDVVLGDVPLAAVVGARRLGFGTGAGMSVRTGLSGGYAGSACKDGGGPMISVRNASPSGLALELEVGADNAAIVFGAGVAADAGAAKFVAAAVEAASEVDVSSGAVLLLAEPISLPAKGAAVTVDIGSSTATSCNVSAGNNGSARGSTLTTGSACFVKAC